MTEDEYQSLPEKITIRLVDIVIDQAGFRSKKYTVATKVLASKTNTRS